MSKKILVIDDDEELLPLLASGLKRAGYEVKTAVDGEEGLETAKEFKPDLVSVDINMPQMDGFEFCKSLREDPGLVGVKIMVLSGKRFQVDIRSAYNLGADAYMTKPYKLKELLASVAGLLSGEGAPGAAPPGA